MTLRADIRAALQQVPVLFGEAWEFRRLTSGPAAQTRAWGAWTAITAHVTGRSDMEQFDEARNVHKRVEVGVMRLPDSATVLHQGDQVRDTTTTVTNPNLWWAIVGVKSSGVGTIAYNLQRDIPLRVEPNRQGGV